MAATSPYQQNDYQAVSNFRPYELPVNDIFKALQAQNQFWEAGAQRVKSVYDNALDLKLTLEPNKELRKKFMEQAEKELVKLSKQDLADPSTQRKGFNIFKPLLQDEGIIYDDAMTRHYENVRSTAMQFRDKDGGKAYSDTNLAYAMDGYNEFATSKDRMAGKKMYAGRKEYTPFYDPTTELAGILKNCKPSTVANDSVKGYYIKGYSDESLTAAKINSCMDAGLSDKAKRQLQINGYVTYRRQPEALRDKYVPHLQGTISQLSEETEAIKGVLANKNSLKSLKKEDLNKIGIADASQVTPELIQALDDRVKLNNARIQNMTGSIQKMIAGDLTDITGNNYEAIAGTVYSRDYMENVGEGFSYDFTKNTMKADPIQMMFFQQAQQNARQEDQQDFDLEKLDKELENDLKVKRLEMMSKTGNLKMMFGMGMDGMIENARVQNDTGSPFSTIDKADSYDQVTARREELSGKKTTLNQWLIKELKSYGLDSSITDTGDARFTNFWANFQTTSSSDPEKAKLVAEYKNKLGEYVSLDDLYRNTQESVDKKIKPLEDKLLADIGSMEAVTVKDANGNVVTINPNDILNSMSGKTSPFSAIGGSGGTGGTASGNVPVSGGYSSANYYYNGVPITATYGSSGYPLHELVRGIRQKASASAANVKSERNKLMQDETVLQREGYAFPFLNSNSLADIQKGEVAGFKESIAQKIGLNLKFIDDLTIGQTDLDGRLIVTLNTDRVKATKEYDADLIIENLKRLNGRDNKVVEGTDNSIVLEGISELDVIDENNLSSIMKPYVRSLEKKANMTQNSSTGFIHSYNGRSYRLDVGQSYNGGYNYKIIDQENTSSPVYSTSDRDDALAKFQTLTRNTGTTIPAPQK
jgi:hypothetical protein